MKVSKNINDVLSKGALCHAFCTASEMDTVCLGQSFGCAVFPFKNQPRTKSVIRVGLCGGMGIGKSPFAGGMLNNGLEKQAVQERPLYRRDQNVWEDREIGCIRHYDAHYALRDHELLPSYRGNDVSNFNPVRTDIVEHPYHDRHDRDFDYLVYFNRMAKGVRHIAVVSPPDSLNHKPFRDFIEQNTGHVSDGSIPPRPFLIRCIQLVLHGF